ncbi:MAG: ATP-binding protein, partial [Methanomicrobiales archaeon]|nr:ATP-binding protein [Methanomicrobiales archaeon]
MRFFNTAGPVNCQDHYCLPPLSRFDLPDILSLIAQKKYFVLHAPRQSGKTSCMLALRDHLNREGNYTALYINVESGQSARGDVGKGIKAVLSELGFQAERTLGDTTLRELINIGFLEFGENAAFKIILSNWCIRHEKPLVLCIDEIDALVGDTL